MHTYKVEEVSFLREGKKIYGKLYMPERNSLLPLVIMEHGFGGNHSLMENYAAIFAGNGFAACAFDFMGGGFDSRSDGKTTDMSVLTEAADLNAVIDGLKKRKIFDEKNIFLFGGSQGGFVATYVAASRPEDIKALVCLYPAYVLQDDARRRTPDPDNIPETLEVMGVTISRKYNVDAMSFDIYDCMKNYPGKVLIIHGTADAIVPVSYSERALRCFPSARLLLIEGGGHGFTGRDETDSAEMALEFIRDNLAG